MSQTTQTRTLLRVGRIEYLNTLPFFHSLGTPELSLRFVRGNPAEVNALIGRGRIDAGLISSLAYADLDPLLYLLPGVCVGSRDQIQSVVLLSRMTMRRLNGQRILTSHKSVSGTALLKIYLKCQMGFENEFEVSGLSPEAMLDRASACLAIGDDALFFRPKRGIYVYDLARLWWSWTKTPFCFALWALRKDFHQKHRWESEEFCRSLLETFRRNHPRLADLADAALKNGALAAEKERIRDYLAHLQYELTEEVQRGLLLFYRYAKGIGLIRDVPKLEFLPIEEGVCS